MIFFFTLPVLLFTVIFIGILLLTPGSRNGINESVDVLNTFKTNDKFQRKSTSTIQEHPNNSNDHSLTNKLTLKTPLGNWTHKQKNDSVKRVLNVDGTKQNHVKRINNFTQTNSSSIVPTLSYNEQKEDNKNTTVFDGHSKIAKKQIIIPKGDDLTKAEKKPSLIKLPQQEAEKLDSVLNNGSLPDMKTDTPTDSLVTKEILNDSVFDTNDQVNKEDIKIKSKKSDDRLWAVGFLLGPDLLERKLAASSGLLNFEQKKAEETFNNTWGFDLEINRFNPMVIFKFRYWI